MGIGTAAAVGIGTAVAGVGSSLLGSSAASSAAGQQSAASQSAAKNAYNQYVLARQDQAPYMEEGATAATQLGNLLGSNGGDSQTTALAQNGLTGLTFQPTQAQLAATPGYQFDLAQGQQAVANSNAAQGRGISGAALKGAASYATGLANNTLTTQDQIFQNNLNNVLNPLQKQASLGESAVGALSGVGTAAQGQSGSDLQAAGTAAASGTVGSANNLSSGINSLSAGSSLYSLLGGSGAGSSSSYNPASFGYTGDTSSAGAGALQSLGFFNPLSS